MNAASGHMQEREPIRSMQRHLVLRHLKRGFCLIIALIIGLLAASVARQNYLQIQHSAVNYQMETSLLRMAFHRPEEVSEGQWVRCIGWSWQLIGNSASNPVYMSTQDLRWIKENLDAKIDNGPSLETISWLWNEVDHRSKINYRRHRVEWEARPEDWDGSHDDLINFQQDYKARMARE